MSLPVRNLRSDLFLQIAITLLAAIILLSFAVYRFIVIPSSDRLGEMELRLASDNVKRTVETFFSVTEAQLTLVRDYATLDYLNREYVGKFNQSILPIIAHNNKFLRLWSLAKILKR